MELYRTNYAVELYRKEATKKERPPAERTVSEQSVGSSLDVYKRQVPMLFGVLVCFIATFVVFGL